MIKLSIVIVNYNVKFFLEQCLLSIFESEVDFKFEVFVVDNNSDDDSIPYLKPRFGEVYFIQNTHNPGFAIANNQAIGLCQGQYLLLLNPDTVLGEDVLSHVIHFLDNHPQAGCAGVKGINGRGKFLPESKRGFPTPWVSFCKIFGLNQLFPMSKLFGKYHLKYLDENQLHEVDVLVGSFMMLRKEALDKVGMLDESFFMYGEDIDLSYRIVKAGYKNYYLPEKIIHYKGESTSKDEMKYVKVFYEAMYIFFKKHFPHYGRIYSLFIAAGIGLRAFLGSIRRILRIKKKSPLQKKTKLLDHSVLSYKAIIETMEEERDTNTEFYISSPKSGRIIGSHYAQAIEK